MPIEDFHAALAPVNDSTVSGSSSSGSSNNPSGGVNNIIKSSSGSGPLTTADKIIASKRSPKAPHSHGNKPIREGKRGEPVQVQTKVEDPDSLEPKDLYASDLLINFFKAAAHSRDSKSEGSTASSEANGREAPTGHTRIGSMSSMNHLTSSSSPSSERNDEETNSRGSGSGNGCTSHEGVTNKSESSAEQVSSNDQGSNSSDESCSDDNGKQSSTSNEPASSNEQGSNSGDEDTNSSEADNENVKTLQKSNPFSNNMLKKKRKLEDVVTINGVEDDEVSRLAHGKGSNSCSPGRTTTVEEINLTAVETSEEMTEA